MDNIPDDNPTTFINENLWKKFGFKFLGYLVYVASTSILLVPWIGWDWGMFIAGLRTIILPLIWSTLDAQARNKEIQAQLNQEAELKAKQVEYDKQKEENQKIIDALQDKVIEQRITIAQVKAELDVKCAVLAANKDALGVANAYLPPPS